MKSHIIVGLCSLLICAPANPAFAADAKPGAAEKGSSGEKAARGTPFHGKIETIDPATKSLKVGTRTFVATDSTKIIKAGKPATFEDAKVGEDVGGTYRDGADGKLELMSLRVGPKPEKEKKK